jgi:hypothetical protein
MFVQWVTHNYGHIILLQISTYNLQVMRLGEVVKKRVPNSYSEKKKGVGITAPKDLLTTYKYICRTLLRSCFSKWMAIHLYDIYF